jgi:hypothetical protein
MQPNKKIESGQSRGKLQVKIHHLSSFGILNRNGLEISTVRDLQADEEETVPKQPEFLDWTMPEQRPGYIQGKKHDFF